MSSDEQIVRAALSWIEDTPHGEKKRLVAEAALERIMEQTDEAAKWLAWSGGRYPDESPGDPIAAEQDGTVTLDDGVTSWNPLRALAYYAAEVKHLTAELDRAWEDARRARAETA